MTFPRHGWPGGWRRTLAGLVGLWLAAAHPVWGGAPIPNAAGYHLDGWQVEDGLPFTSVTGVAQTPEGYLWVSTFNGVARFDGTQFKVFDAGNTPALDSGRITGLEVDPAGTLWLVTETGGLARMTAGRFSAVRAPEGLPAAGARFLLRDPTNGLVLLDRASRLTRLTGNRVVPLAEHDPLRGEDELIALLHNNGRSWLGRAGRARPAFGATLTLQTGEAGGRETGIDLPLENVIARRGGGYWVTTRSNLYQVDSARRIRQTSPLPRPAGSILLEDARGALWLCGWETGLMCREPDGAWRRFEVEAGLTNLAAMTLFCDREANVWLGTANAGLFRVKPSLFRTYGRPDGVAGEVVMCVAEDRRGRKWFGVNGGGLHCWEDGRLWQVTEPPALRRDFSLTYSLLLDHEDNLWLGSYRRGAARLRDHQLTHFPLKDTGAGPRVFLEDRAGVVWLGTDEGLYRFADGRMAPAPGFAGLWITALAEDRAGTLFVGTSVQGLKTVRGGQVVDTPAADGLPDNHISALYVDHEDALWVGTVNGGLCRRQAGRFLSVSGWDSLPSQTINGILEDDVGNLWVGLNRGLACAPWRQLTASLTRPATPVNWRLFDRSDGLQSIQCGSGAQPSCCRARDGRLWFATANGLAVVDPRQLAPNPLAPPVVIEDVLFDGRPVGAVAPAGPDAPTLAGATGLASSLAPPQPPRVTVPSSVHRVEVHFTGLSLTAPQKVRFRHRLEPFDPEWVSDEARRFCDYSGLRPGRYQFHVTACNEAGVWHAAGAALEFEVLPPWWRTLWFRVLAGLAVGGSLGGVGLLRGRRLREERRASEGFARQLIVSQEKERQRIAGELHDGLGQDLLVVHHQATLALTAPLPPAAAQRVRDIATTTKQALEQVRQISHNLRPRLLDALGFTEAARAMLERGALAAGLPVHLELQCVDGLLPAEFEVSLFRILQEALNNTLKHAHATSLRVTLAAEPAWLRLVFLDDGCGFDPAALPSAACEPGLGLTQMAERVRLMGGRFALQASPGQGTRLTIELPRQS